MKSSTLLQIALGAGITSVMAPASSAALLLYYSFDNDAPLAGGSSINNLVGATDGTFLEGANTGSVASFVASTLPGGNGGTALSFLGGDGVNDTDYISTNFTSTALGISPSTAYTSMAWVRFGAQVNDNIIFGTENGVAGRGGPTLHLGSRGAGYHSGHWADDFNTVNGDPLDDPDPVTDTSAWHHVAFTNNTSGLQEIFVDGVSVGTGANGTGGAFGAGNVILGTASPGDSSFIGTFDEVKIYDTVLTAAEIVDASQVAPIPEPTTFLALTGGAAMLLGLRRRRS